MDVYKLIAVIFSIILIGFFSGLEITFQSANKFTLDLNKKTLSYSGKTWGWFDQHTMRFLGALIVAIQVMTIVYGLLIGELLFPLWALISSKLPEVVEPYMAYIRLFVEILIASGIILIFMFIMRAIFKSNSNKVLKSNPIAYLAKTFTSIFGIITGLFINISLWIVKYLFNANIVDRKSIFSKTESETYLQQIKSSSTDETNHINNELFENALSLRKVKLRESLVPRKEIVGVPATASIEELRQKFIDTRLSKLIIYEDNLDNIIGYVHQLEIFNRPTTIKEALLPIPTVPESMNATDLMTKFSKERKSIAWVIDEFGGTAGIVTMEDLQEEIFGDIKDEYDDVEEFIDKQLSQSEFLFSGRMELDFITDKYGIQFPDAEDAQTLSGYIVQQYDGLPKENAKVIFGNIECTILSTSETKIESVKLKILE